MDVNAIKTIARQELVINIRNRWTLVFAGIFGVLVLAILFRPRYRWRRRLPQGFSTSAASYTVLYLVPLMALTMGTLSFTNEKSAGELRLLSRSRGARSCWANSWGCLLRFSRPH